ncbi:MAG TPA: serine/threonine-protein kinase [Vicinamibacterales bacterium]
MASTNDKVLLNKATELPSGHPHPRGRQAVLPSELLREASGRLGWAGGIYAVGYTLAYWVPFFVQRTQNPGAPFLVIENVFAIASILLGAVVFIISRYATLAPERLLDIGLVFAVAGAFGISMAEFWRGLPRVIQPTVFLGVPWECVWILIIPLVAPNLPKKILIVSLLEASTGPLVLWYAAAVRGENVSNSAISLATYFLFTTYLCAGIAYVTSRFVFLYGMRLKRAREIGSYELVSRLGEGGMGEVWVARHRMLARPAAMKLIRPELLGTDLRNRDRAVARFRREAKSTAALGSTHTVDIYDFGLTEEGSFFYVMELLDGLSLETLVRRFGPVSPARAVYLLRQVCHSLGEAHAAGLIHRDVKPANIFACRLGPDLDHVKVLDFGLVKHIDPQEMTLTAEYSTAGTPAYMAPEMALGQPDIDSRADLYAVGCVAYWLLTGEPVFEGDTPMATLIAQVQATPVAPSLRSETDVPQALDEVILSCLAKDPADRPQTAEELARRFAASVPEGSWRREDAREWWLRHHPGTPVSEVEHTPLERVTIAG